MNLPSLQVLRPDLESLAREAGDGIRELYEATEPCKVTTKQDASPLTQADIAADKILRSGLESLTAWPVLSEEAVIPWQKRRHWSTYWLIDPLDGTKGFVARNAAFTVNIALIAGGCPVLGVLHDPLSGDVWSGIPGSGAYKNGAPLMARPRSSSLTAVVSQAHQAPRTEEFLDQHRVTGRLKVGSSIKFAMVAEGLADLYPRLGPTHEWDIAAGHALVEAAGGRVVHLRTGAPLVYGKEDLINPPFVAWRG